MISVLMLHSKSSFINEQYDINDPVKSAVISLGTDRAYNETWNGLQNVNIFLY
jgi:hypothetical protein